MRAIAGSLRRDSRQRGHARAGLRTYQKEYSCGESHSEGTTRTKRKAGDSRMNGTNYKNRKARGQCVSCKDQAIQNSVRCQSCKDKHREKCRVNYESYYVKRRKKLLERERRLDEIEARLKQEVLELEKALVR